MISILLIVATMFFVGLAVYAVRTRGVRRGRFLLGLLAWCIVSTFIFHVVRYPVTAAIDLGAKIALLIDCVLLVVWRPGRREPMPRT
jgi:hypothetical protein